MLSAAAFPLPEGPEDFYEEESVQLSRIARNVSRRPLSLLSFFILAGFFSAVSLAQTFTSSIAGVITDPSGADVTGAKIELKNMGTNNAHQVTSLDNGSYQFNNLPPGTYQLTVTAPGFQTYEQQNLILQAQVATTVNVSLKLGNTQQKVEVTSSAVLVDTQTANNSVTLDSHLIEALPNNTRNPLNFVFAVAGTTVAPGGQTQTAGSLDQMSSNFGINGGRTGEETILIDGAPSQAVDWGGLMVAPLQDSVQEQQILVNTYDAQYERGGAGIVTLITKGGTNRFHGEAYDYLQNSALDANSWYNNKYGFPKGQFKQNQFGGNISGPLLKRANLFFFGGYEGLRQPNTQTTLTTVPTQAQRSGNFSTTLNPDGSPTVIYNPFTTTPASNTTGYTRTPFANNVILPQLINPVGAKIVSLYPLPNHPGTGPNQLNNYANTGAGNTLNDKMDTRVDWEQNSVHRMFIRWSDRFRQDQVIPCFFCNGADTGVNQTNYGFQVVINDTVTPSPTWVINSYISYSHWLETHIAQGYGVASAATIGLSPSLFQAPLMPPINADNGYSSLGNGTFEHFARTSDEAQINLTKQFSSHTLKFGANFEDQMNNVLNESAGSFNFGSGMTSCDPDPSGTCAALPAYQSSTLTGNAIASMLLGTPGSGSQSINFTPALSLHTFGAYIQDQWRVNPRLTVNIGVRYENQRPATERYDRFTYFDPGAVNPLNNAISPAYGTPVSQVLGHPLKGAFAYAAANDGRRFLWPPNNHDFAPRAGIAYKITDRLVARIGGGIFFLPPTALIGDDSGLAFGFDSFTTSFSTVDNIGFIPQALISNPFPNGINQPTGSSLGPMTLVGDGVCCGSGMWLKQPHPDPYTEQWSFDLQYQLGAHSVLEAGYMGNRGRKLLYGNPGLDYDQLPTGLLSLGSATLNAQVPNPFAGLGNPNSALGSPGNGTILYNQLLRPYPEYTALQLSRSYQGARSSFNALNVKYNRQFTGGLSLLMTYQWSKALDNGPEDYFGWATGGQWRDFYNTNLDYNISTHDIPQSFATALVYDLPYGRGKHWGNNAPFVVKEILGNWQISSVIRLTSGAPLGQVTENPYSNPLNQYGFPGGALPDWVSNPRAYESDAGQLDQPERLRCAGFSGDQRQSQQCYLPVR